MSKWPKIFLAMSIVTFGFGLTSVGSSIGYGILKPVGAIFFMVFYLTQLLEKEAARYDEEHRSQRPLTKSNSVSAAAPRAGGGGSGEAHGGAMLAAGQSR